MNLQEWKAKKKKDFTLSSGLTVTIRRLSPFALMEIGQIPYLEAVGPERWGENAKGIIMAGLIAPKIGEGDDEIRLSDLSYDETNELVEAIIDAPKKREEGTEGVPLETTG